jgi:hypothetical protein
MKGLTFVAMFMSGDDLFAFLSPFRRQVQTGNLISEHVVTNDEPRNGKVQLQAQGARKVRSVVQNIQVM